MENPAVVSAGHTRSRRMDPSPHDLAHRIVALQRKNAVATAPSRLPPRKYEDVDEFNRGMDRPGPSKALYDPSQPAVSRLEPTGQTPPPQYEPRDPRLRDSRDREVRESKDLKSRQRIYEDQPRSADLDRRFDLRKGKESGYDDDIDSRIHRPSSRHHPSSRADPRHAEGGKKLFDPEVHDPRRFQPRSPTQSLAPSLPSISHPASDHHHHHQPSHSSRSTPRHTQLYDPNQPRAAIPNGHLHPSMTPSEVSSGSRSLLRKPGSSARTPEEEADRARERRKRREGSERGSMHSKRKEGDTQSHESRSSGGSESLKDRERGKGKSDTGIKAILKDIHNKIRSLETELNEMHRLMALDPEAGIAALMEDSRSRRKPKEDDAAAWLDLISKHKELADLHHLFLVRVFDPLVPSTFQQLAVKYNIPSRLWQVSFHLILERLRLAWMTAHPAALDLLTDLVYDAYKFYTDLLEDQAMAHFRTAWIEALGDLARYRMTIASHVNEGRVERTTSGVAAVDEDGPPEPSDASIGAEVAQNWDVEDKETWRTTARDWYTIGITEKPGEGRLHHHLALLCRDVPGLEGRALHHYTKSLVVTHEYATSRESILPLFDSALQSQRSQPEAGAVDLFVRLHGMLFTRIDLDNFPSVMSRFMERLDEDALLDRSHRKARISQVDWMLFASVNVAAVLQYGSSTGLIRKALAMEGHERRRAHAAAEEDAEGDADPDREQHSDEVNERPISIPPTVPESTSNELPKTLSDAIELTLTIFTFLLANPFRQQGLQPVLNPYITIVLTYIATLSRQPHVGEILLPHIPWNALVELLNKYSPEIKEESRLATNLSLPEDWTVRGMEWVGRRVYERGFWKTKAPSGRGSGAMAQPQPRSGERFTSEMDVLLANFESTMDLSEGVVEEVDAEGEGGDQSDGVTAVNSRRWKRVAWAAGVMVKHVEGLELRDGKVVIEGPLKDRLDEIERMREVERTREEEELVRKRERETKEEEEVVAGLVDGMEDDEDDDPELAVLRERRKHLQALLSANAPTAPAIAAPIPASSSTTSARKAKRARKSLNVIPGYTMLVFDTNVLLSSLGLFERVVQEKQWSVIVPLPVVTELDGLAKNPAPLGTAASSAISFLEKKIKSHSLNLKIQTSRGNYLSDLLIRTESHFDPSSTSERARGRDGDHDREGRTMDDLILNVASFQSEHFSDKSTLLHRQGKGDGVGKDAVKVLLVTFDRNLRLRARGRGIDAADEREMASILGQ